MPWFLLPTLLLAATATGPNPVVLQLRFDHQFQFAGYYAAEWEGYYDQAGLDVVIRSGVRPDGTVVSVIDELKAGRADFGVAAGDALVANDQGVPLVLVASFFQRSPVEVISLESTGLSSPADLIDLRVQQGNSALLDIELWSMLKAEGLDPDSIQLIPVPEPYSVQRHYDQLFTGRVDATLTYALSMLWYAKERGFRLHRLRPSSYGVDFYGDALFVHRKWIENDPELVERFRLASIKGWEYALRNPEAVIQRISRDLPRSIPLSDRVAYDRFLSEPIRELMLYPEVEVGHTNPLRWRVMNEAMRDAGLVEKELNTDNFVFDIERIRDERMELIQRRAIMGLAAVGTLLLALLFAAGLRRRLERQRAVEKRIASEERLRLACDAARIGIWSWDAAQDRVTWDDRMHQLFGVPLDAPPITVQGFEDSVVDEDRARVRRELGQAFQSDKVYEIEYRIHHPSKGLRWLVTRGKAFRGPDGKILRMTGAVTDTSARKAAEEQIIRSESRYRRLVDSSPYCIHELDTEGRIVSMNHAGLSMLGLANLDEIKGQPYLSAVCDDDQSRIRQLMENALKGSESQFEFTSRQGQVFNSSFVPLSEPDGRISGLMGITQDITARKSAEKRMAESEALLHEVERIAGVGGWEMDLVARTSEWTLGTYDIMEIDPGQPVPGPDDPLRFFLPEYLPMVGDAVRRLIEEDAPLEIEAELNTAKGNLKWCRSLGHGVWENGRCIKIHGTIQDISKRRKAEEEREELQAQLLQSHKMEAVGRLAGGVAHDFNNMLAVILGYSDMAINDAPSDSELLEPLQNIHSAAQRSAVLTRQLLAFARKQDILPRVLDLNQTIFGMLSMLRRLIGEDISLEWKPGDEVGPIRFDPSQIDQILANLVVNARDAIGGTGKIVIGTRSLFLESADPNFSRDLSAGKFAVLSVSDDGQGMDRDTLDHIFEPFYTTKHTGEGTGLGLSTVYGILKQNGGDVVAYSEPGMGSTFKVYFPSVDEPISTEPAPHPIPIEEHRGTESILIVEDEPLILDLAKRVLEGLGYRILAASSPHLALQLAAAGNDSPDLLFTDVVMPEMNGRELAESLRAAHPNMKCLYTSGYTADIIGHHGVLEAEMNFIEKPYSVRMLAAKIREVLDTE